MVDRGWSSSTTIRIHTGLIWPVELQSSGITADTISDVLLIHYAPCLEGLNWKHLNEMISLIVVNHHPVQIEHIINPAYFCKTPHILQVLSLIYIQSLDRKFLKSFFWAFHSWLWERRFNKEDKKGIHVQYIFHTVLYITNEYKTAAYEKNKKLPDYLIEKKKKKTWERSYEHV